MPFWLSHGPGVDSGSVIGVRWKATVGERVNERGNRSCQAQFYLFFKLSQTVLDGELLDSGMKSR